MLLSLKKALISRERLSEHTCIKPVLAGLELPELPGGGNVPFRGSGPLAGAEGSLPEAPRFPAFPAGWSVWV